QVEAGAVRQLLQSDPRADTGHRARRIGVRRRRRLVPDGGVTRSVFRLRVDGERDRAVDRHVMHGHAGAPGAAGFWPLTAMWLGMMTAMMAPTVWPWVRSFHRLSGRESGRRVRATAEFVTGYLIAWLAYSIGAASLQLVLQRAGML